MRMDCKKFNKKIFNNNDLLENSQILIKDHFYLNLINIIIN